MFTCKGPLQVAVPWPSMRRQTVLFKSFQLLRYAQMRVSEIGVPPIIQVIYIYIFIYIYNIIYIYILYIYIYIYIYRPFWYWNPWWLGVPQFSEPPDVLSGTCVSMIRASLEVQQVEPQRESLPSRCTCHEGNHPNFTMDQNNCFTNFYSPLNNDNYSSPLIQLDMFETMWNLSKSNLVPPNHRNH